MKDYPKIISEYINVTNTTDIAPFIYYYSLDKNDVIQTKSLTRSEFLNLAQKAAFRIKENGITCNEKILFCFGENNITDLIFRFACIITGTVPVTVNWQADPLDRIYYKLQKSKCKALIFGEKFNRNFKIKIKKKYSELKHISIENLIESPSLAIKDFEKSTNKNSTKMIVFTSGTTGEPKGVQLSYHNYRTTALEFRDMLNIGKGEKLAVILTNPLHHGNSSSFSDILLRYPNGTIHLINKYTTKYWQILRDITKNFNYDRIIAPAVARHFEYLESLIKSNKLPYGLKTDELIKALNKIDFVIGSAPVGPAAINYLKKYTGKIPCVRYGGTETTLQSVGIPQSLSQPKRDKIFKKGWNHTINGAKSPGYYIGRANEPYVQVKLVKSISKNDPDFLKEVAEGEPGYFIAKGDNIMIGYVNNTEATTEVMSGEWYLGLKDIGFYFTDSDIPQDDKGVNNTQAGHRNDFYWMNRDSAMLIRGGANYSYDQINHELSELISKEYNLPMSDFFVAVIGLKLQSESEDDCCVTIQFITNEAKAKQQNITDTFIDSALKQVSKGAVPNKIRFAKIPRNFKGAILVKELKKDYEAFLIQNIKRNI